MARKSSRRDFLRGKAAAQAAADAMRAAVSDDDNSLPDNAEPSLKAANKGYILRFCRQAMACEFEICLNAGEYSHGMDAALAALDMVDSLESRLSVFRDDSELAEVNRFAAEQAVPVSDDVFELLSRAAELYRCTDRAFDISAAPLSDAWGFSRREGRIPSEAELSAALELVGMDKVVLDAEDKTVAFTRAGVRLNLGAIGKGYAIDRAAEVLESAGVENFMIHGGQSSVLGRGSSIDEPHRPVENTSSSGDVVTKGGWTVGLADPLLPDKRLAEIRLRNRSLATSGSAKQFFYYHGQRYSHVLDPRNGQPAQGVLSATVLAASAADADALATAVFVLGPDRSQELFAERSDVGVAAVLPDRGGRRGEIVSFGLENQDLKLV